MIELILLPYLAYRNSVRAKLKDHNAILWAFITVIAFLIAEIIGFIVVLLFFCGDIFDFNSLSRLDPKAQQEAAHQMAYAFANYPIRVITVYVFAFGGYLLIRFIIDKMPGKPQTPPQDIHWMDRMNNRDQ